jgi:hypothetical protein
MLPVSAGFPWQHMTPVWVVADGRRRRVSQCSSSGTRPRFLWIISRTSAHGRLSWRSVTTTWKITTRMPQPRMTQPAPTAGTSRTLCGTVYLKVGLPAANGCSPTLCPLTTVLTDCVSVGLRRRRPKNAPAKEEEGGESDNEEQGKWSEEGSEMENSSDWEGTVGSKDDEEDTAPASPPLLRAEFADTESGLLTSVPIGAWCEELRWDQAAKQDGEQWVPDPQDLCDQLARLSMEPDTSQQDAEGTALLVDLHQAVAARDVAQVRTLVETLGVDVNGLHSGDTALHTAAATGQTEMVRVLVGLGAALAKPNACDATPVMLSKMLGHEHVTACLEAAVTAALAETVIPSAAGTCAMCGAHRPPSAAPFRGCVCAAVVYCSHTCRSTHWPLHEKSCTGVGGGGGAQASDL